VRHSILVKGFTEVFPIVDLCPSDRRQRRESDVQSKLVDISGAFIVVGEPGSSESATEGIGQSTYTKPSRTPSHSNTDCDFSSRYWPPIVKEASSKPDHNG
jgi:hypothetical protein